MTNRHLCSAAVLLVAGACSSEPAEAPRNHETAVTVLGAAGRVSGSMSLIESNRQSWLVDAGLFYPEGGRSPEALNDDIPTEATAAEAVFLTHAHLDHVGRLSSLFNRGFRGNVYATAATASLLPEMLGQAIRYSDEIRQWRWSAAGRDRHAEYVTAHWNQDCEWARKISARNLVTRKGRRADIQASAGFDLYPCKVCLSKELERPLRALKTLRYGQAVQLGDGISAVMLDAGHIPGSASVLFSVGGTTPHQFLFSGDVGNNNSTLIDGPGPPPPVDALWLESTYGSHTRAEPADTEAARFRRDVGSVVAAGGIAWIPAFALDRTQKMLVELQQARREGILPGTVPIFVGSPTALTITERYSAELRSPSSDRWFRRALYDQRPAFAPFEAKLPDEIQAQSVVMTSSGMLDLGLSEKLSIELLSRIDVTVFLVGYQDPSSPGGQLTKGVRLLSIDGRTVEVRASIRRYGAFSAHADATDLAQWLANQDRGTRIRLVHGPPDSLEALRRSLSQRGFSSVSIAKYGERTPVPVLRAAISR